MALHRGENEPLSLGFTLWSFRLQGCRWPWPQSQKYPLLLPIHRDSVHRRVSLSGGSCFCSQRETGLARLQVVCLDPRPFSRCPEAGLGGGPGFLGSFFVCLWTKGPNLSQAPQV